MKNNQLVLKNNSKSPKIYAVDLFCGAGGLTHGLIKAGIDVRLGVDIDPACKYPFVANNQSEFLLKSVDDLESEDLIPYYRKNGIKLLAGCAPCQTFSTYNQKANETDKRWWLLKQFSRLAQEILPDLITMENVPRLLKQNIFHEFVFDLESKGYFVDFKVINSLEYGIPQQRSRLVLIASKLGEIRIITPSEFGRKPKSVKQAISKLPPLKAGEQNKQDPLHCSSTLSDLNLRRIRASRPGGTWRDWPKRLVAECHRKESGKTYPGVYGRMSWDEPAPTLTTQFYGFGNGRFGHPEQDRAISLREGAILQSFPPDYKFIPPGEEVCIKAIGRLIGNAVPVTLGEVIGSSLLSHVSEIKRKARQSDSRKINI